MGGAPYLVVAGLADAFEVWGFRVGWAVEVPKLGQSIGGAGESSTGVLAPAASLFFDAVEPVEEVLGCVDVHTPSMYRKPYGVNTMFAIKLPGDLSDPAHGSGQLGSLEPISHNRCQLIVSSASRPARAECVLVRVVAHWGHIGFAVLIDNQPAIAIVEPHGHQDLRPLPGAVAVSVVSADELSDAVLGDTGRHRAVRFVGVSLPWPSR